MAEQPTETWEVWHHPNAAGEPRADLRGEWTDERGKTWGCQVNNLTPYVAERLADRLNLLARMDADLGVMEEESHA